MKNRVPQKIIRRLEEIARCASLRDASFGFNTDTVTRDSTGKSEPITDFVKEAVRLHHDTWIRDPLALVIDWAKGETTTDEIDYQIGAAPSPRMQEVDGFWSMAKALGAIHADLTSPHTDEVIRHGPQVALAQKALREALGENWRRIITERLAEDS